MIKLVRRFTDIGREEWDSLVGPDGSPFLEWDWLASLEESGSASADTGWAPHHVTLRENGRLVGAVPLYLKGHSQGEFVFDHAWAEAAARAGLPYYPKMLAAVPFTPVTGRRLLTHPAHPRPALLGLLAGTLREICTANDLSSAHVNFCEADEVAALRAAGFLHRQGIQYHWRNHAYGSFDDYLAALRSKRRNQVRRERREIAASGIEIAVLEGDEIPPELIEPMFRIYRSTVDKMVWGSPYLNRRFFALIGERWKRNLCLVVARRRGEVVAGTINAQKAGIFYGRYWGTFQEIRNLHFEVCYYSGIEHCIARGFERFEPGAGGDFKYWRGFEPVATHSMHFLPHAGFARAVGDFLAREREYVDETIEQLGARKPLLF